jgi:spore maturation protein CgeB
VKLTTATLPHPVLSDGCGIRHLPRLTIVGAFDGTHIGGSLARAAAQLGIDPAILDVAKASRGNRFVRALNWRLADRRPLHLKRTSAEIVASCAAGRADILISTGAAPLIKEHLSTLRAAQVICVNYSTDDPWNPAHRARWHLRALPAYDIVFTTRHANIDEFRKLGCPDVRYLPFGYDDALFGSPERTIDVPSYDVLFVGGADPDRVAFVADFVRKGPPPALVGGYWERIRATRRYALGHKTPEAVRALTASAKVNLCLVRRANRDGHVMRSFEIAAIGGCMLVEDTDEHRAIFGTDGEAVVYFRTPNEAAARVKSLLANPVERTRLGASVHSRITSGAHTYRDRLATMLETAAAQRNRKEPTR